MLDDPSDKKLSELRERVQRNPTDLALRLELGKYLVEINKYKEAIPELQKARMNPHIRLQAMQLLVRAFKERGFSDLADKIQKDIKDEFPDDDDDCDGSADSGFTAPLKPISPRDLSTARELPSDDGEAEQGAAANP